MNLVTSVIIFASFLIIVVLYGVGSIIQKQEKFCREKSSVYECGLDPNMSARVPFSLRFFLLAVILLVLDVEIALLMASPMSFSSSFSWTVFSVSLFLFILFFGLVHEWREGSLDWM